MPDTNASHANAGAPQDIFARMRRITQQQAGAASVSAPAATSNGMRVAAAPAPAPAAAAGSSATTMASLLQRMSRLPTSARQAAPVTPVPTPSPMAAPAPPSDAAERAPSSGVATGGSVFSRLLAMSGPDEGTPSLQAEGGDAGEGGGNVGGRQETETVRGLVERMQVYNAGWGIAFIWTEDRQNVKVTGAVVGELKEGLSYEFQGNFRTSQHGDGFAAVSAKPHLECDRRAIVRFIARSFKGVGETTADKFVQRQISVAEEQGKTEAEALEEIRRTLVTAPWTLDMSAVTKKGQFEGETTELMSEAVKRDLATRIGQYEGVKEPVLKGMAAWLLSQEMLRRSQSDAPRAPGVSPDLVDKCWGILATNPYAPIGQVTGFGFKTADAIGRALNIPRNAPQRLAALASYAVSNACSRGGHLFLNEAEVREAIREVDAAVDAAETLQAALSDDRIRKEEMPQAGGGRATIYYDSALHDVEHKLARQLAGMLREQSRPLSKEPAEQLRAKLQATAKRLNPNLANGLDESQLNALVGILTSRARLHTITAGPGCGKTSIMEVLTAHLGAERFDYCAPTGRAALVLGNRLSQVGGSASTIHSLFRGGAEGFQVNEDNPLSSDILVVDEGSMPPAALWTAMLAGLSKNQHVVVLGDVGQLPSIEPGRVLEDLLQVPQADKHRLTASHRAAGGLLEVLAQIDRGTVDCKDREDVKFSHGLPPAELGFEAVAQEYIEAVGQYGFPQVALLMSRRKGDAAKPDWNVTYANARLRELCNPNAPKVPGTRLHIGDRVIFRENLKVPRGSVDPDAPESDDPLATDRVTVVNGDTGTVKDFIKGKGTLSGARWIRVTLDDGRDVHYPSEGAIDHAYAITVHSAQGGEYRRVVAVVTPGQPSFVNRVMLRTQLSRARQLMTVHADDAVLRRVAATPMPARNSRLVQLVKQYIEQPSGDDEAESETQACENRCSA